MKNFKREVIANIKQFRIEKKAAKDSSSKREYIIKIREEIKKLSKDDKK